MFSNLSSQATVVHCQLRKVPGRRQVKVLQSKVQLLVTTKYYTLQISLHVQSVAPFGLREVVTTTM